MPEPTDAANDKKHFLDVEDAEVVDGADVIAREVSGALKDADRFDLPHVKPPLSDALNRVRDEGLPAAATPEPGEQDALSGAVAQVDEGAGSAEVLQPAERAQPG